MVQVKIEYERPAGTTMIELSRNVEEENLNVVLGEMIYSIEVQTESFKTGDVYETVIGSEEFQKITGRRKKLQIPTGDDLFAISFATKAKAPAKKTAAKKTARRKK